MFPSQHFDGRASCGEITPVGQEDTKRLQRGSWWFSRPLLVEGSMAANTPLGAASHECTCSAEQNHSTGE